MIDPEVSMNSLDIYNVSLKPATELRKFLMEKGFTPVEIAGALMINMTSISMEGKPIAPEFISDLAKDFCNIRDEYSNSHR
jgi:hypothetical protein